MEVLVLVDNATDFLSSTSADAETEISRFWRRGARLQAGNLLCCAAHGFSCAITVRKGNDTRTLLFDAGPDGEVLKMNSQRLGFDMGTVDALFLSHGHWDHAGGMLVALDMVRQARGGRRTPTYMHPDIYRSRGMKTTDRSIRRFADVPALDMLEAHGADVVHGTRPQTILDNCILISGEIPRTTSFEMGMPGQYRLGIDGSTWEPDPLLQDERFVVARVKGHGAFVFSACSHAGIVNVLKHVQTLLPGEPLHGVIGGFHLAGANERAIPETVESLRHFGLRRIAPAHCTGWRAVGALAAAFGDAVAPSFVGQTYRL